MGFFKKIFRPVAKVLDKVIPNEIKPVLPYAAAFAPFVAPGIFGAGASRIGNFLKAGQYANQIGGGILGAGLNIGAQLSQEGSEGDINLLSAGLGALQGAMAAPGAADAFTGATTKGRFGLGTAPDAVTGGPMQLDRIMEGRSLLTKAKDFGLESLARGSEFITEGMAGGLTDKAQVLALPAATATGDVMEAEARRLNKQAIIDQALGGLEEGFSSADAAQAIRLSMLQYGFDEDEITETIASAGYKAGGRVGFRFGGIDEAIDKIETEKITELVESDKGGLDSIKDKMAGMGNVMKLFEKDFGGFDRAGFEDMLIQYSDSGAKAKGVKLMDFALDFLGISSMKDGGLMDLGGKEMDLRGGGFVPIGKKEKADDVPARLSKNEFVMTADAVRAAGGGSVNKGAKRMYDLMNNLEARA